MDVRQLLTQLVFQSRQQLWDAVAGGGADGNRAAPFRGNLLYLLRLRTGVHLVPNRDQRQVLGSQLLKDLQQILCLLSSQFEAKIEHNLSSAEWAPTVSCFGRMPASMISTCTRGLARLNWRKRCEGSVFVMTL